MRIAHFSDLHLCSIFKQNNFIKIENAIEEAIKRGAQHFIFTGDISDNSNDIDFLKFKEILIKQNIYNSLKTTITIGNHDIFGGPQTASDLINFPSKCLNTNFNEKVNSFINNFKELFENCFTIDKEFNFPFLKIVNDNVFIIINSIDQYSRFKNPFASNGRVKKEIRKKIDKLLKLKIVKNKLKIVVIHHHFYHNKESSTSSENYLWNKLENFTMKLKHKKKLIKLFRENDIKIVLHGHSHEIREYVRDGIHFFNSGGAFEGDAFRIFLINAFKFDLSFELIESEKTIEKNEILISKVAI